MLALQPDFYSPKAFLKGFSHLWFLLCLLVLFVFMAWFRRYLLPQKRSRQLAVLLLSYVFSCVVGRIDVLARPLGLFCLDRVIFYFPIFYLGIILPSFLPSGGFKWSCKMLLFLALIAGVVGLVANATLHFTNGGVLSFIGLTRLMGCLVVVSLLLLSASMSKSNALLRFLDKNSMGVYIVHQILLFYFLQYPWFLDMVRTNVPVAVAGLFISILLASLLVSNTLLHSRLRFTLG